MRMVAVVCVCVCVCACMCARAYACAFLVQISRKAVQQNRILPRGCDALQVQRELSYELFRNSAVTNGVVVVAVAFRRGECRAVRR